jgi:hypothetical protein
MLKNFFTVLCIAAVLLFNLAACSPQFDWREVHGSNPPFVVMLPAKPSTVSRSINLDGQQVTMTMTSAKVDGVTFAVGTATMSDPQHAAAALIGMKTALIKNIGANADSAKSQVDISKGSTSASAIDIDVVGPSSATSNGQPVRLVAHFVAKGSQVYELVVVGREKAITHDVLDMFFTSFKSN